MCVYTHMLYVCMCVYIYLYIYTYTHTHTIDTCTYICRDRDRICMYACMDVRKYACMDSVAHIMYPCSICTHFEHTYTDTYIQYMDLKSLYEYLHECSEAIHVEHINTYIFKYIHTYSAWILEAFTSTYMNAARLFMPNV